MNRSPPFILTSVTEEKSNMIRALLAGSLLLRVCPPIIAQSPAPAEAAVRELCPGHRIQVAVGPRRMEGYCGFVDSAAVPLRMGTDERVVPLAEIQSVWVEVPATGRGAAIGGALGFGLGAAMGALLGTGLCESANGCTGETVRLGILGGAAVGAGGAVVGALLGSFDNSWSRRYP